MSTNTAKENFSRNLTKLIYENKMSQKDLSLAIGSTPSAVNSWCSGKKFPRIESIEKIASYFNVSKSSLIEENVCRKNIYDEILSISKTAEQKENIFTLLNIFVTLNKDKQERLIGIAELL